MPIEQPASSLVSLPPEVLLNILIRIETPYLTDVVRLTHFRHGSPAGAVNVTLLLRD